MHDYDFGVILLGMLNYARYRDHVVAYNVFDGQNVVRMCIIKPGGEPFEVELRFKVL